MKLSAYLRDRAPWIIAYLLFGVLAVAVVQLDLWLSQASLQRANLAYIALLGGVGLFGALLYDYQRQCAFWRWLAEKKAALSLDDLGLLPEPATAEQQQYLEAWSALYSRLRAELTAEQQRGRRQVHLVSQWAHHMKTPVAVIDLELQQARKRPGAPALQPVLDSLAEENQRLGHSLQMLLGAVRLEDFAQDFRVEPVDLVALVRQLVNEHKRELIARRVYPRIELPEGASDGAFTVRSDAKWLRFVLEQLLSNAIKYASGLEREGRVIFRCLTTDAGIVLEVADNGIGIAREEVGRVFQPFFTGSNGRTHAQSTGMGLYLARETCQRLGHRIHLASEPGQGTCVTLEFPPDATLFAGLAAPAASLHDM